MKFRLRSPADRAFVLLLLHEVVEILGCEPIF
jgi:hypothetical protein